MELLLLHGFGATPADLSDVAGSLRTAMTGWAVRTVAGPVHLADGRRAWWNDHDAFFPDAGHALTWIGGQIGTAPTVIAGFSQGGALAIACGFGGAGGAPVRGNVHGVACIGGFVPEDVLIGPHGVPLFVGHGLADEIVDVFHAESHGRNAKRHGIAADVVLHDGGHEWPETVTDALVAWLRRLP